MDRQIIWREAHTFKDGSVWLRLYGPLILPDTDIMGPDTEERYSIIISLGGRREFLTEPGASLQEAKQQAARIIVTYAADMAKAAAELAEKEGAHGVA